MRRNTRKVKRSSYRQKSLKRANNFRGSSIAVSNRFKVVALGGGTGLPVVLRILKDIIFPSLSRTQVNHEKKRLTAIVTVTDDGGSSGRLRKDFDILAPGDIRNCILALSNRGIILEDLFRYRFEKGDGLSGHSLGNLLLTALTDLKGNFIEAVQCCSEILDISGQVLPLTSTNTLLGARFTDGSVEIGECSIVRRNGKIKQVFLIPKYSGTLISAIDAIEKADMIIIGPGSLYTSIIPNLLVEDVVNAIKISCAKKIYICNQMTEPGETDGYTATDHVKAILEHTEYGLFQYVILNKGKVSSNLLKAYRDEGSYPVKYDIDELRNYGLTSIATDLISEKGNIIRHDENKLGELLIELSDF